MTGDQIAPSQRWLARCALAAMMAAYPVLVVAEGATGLTLLVTGLVGAGLVLAGGFWFLAKRGALRWIGLTVAILAVVLVLRPGVPPPSPRIEWKRLWSIAFRH